MQRILQQLTIVTTLFLAIASYSQLQPGILFKEQHLAAHQKSPPPAKIVIIEYHTSI
jgi:hypothetical protein